MGGRLHVKGHVNTKLLPVTCSFIEEHSADSLYLIYYRKFRVYFCLSFDTVKSTFENNLGINTALTDFCILS